MRLGYIRAGFLLLAISPNALAQKKSKAHLAPSNSIPPATLESIIESVRPPIVQIVVNFEYRTQERTDPLPGSSSGTGFIVDGAGHIATAGHVVSLEMLRLLLKQQFASTNQHLIEGIIRIKRIQVIFPVPSVESDSNGNKIYGNNDASNATVLAEDDAIDVAVLACDRNPLTLSSGFIFNGKPLRPLAQVPKLQTTPPHDGDMISVSGFPLNIPVLVTNTGWIASAFFMDERGRSLYLGDISVNHGNSGGPAYNDADGSIIGCVTEYRPAPEGNSRLTVIVPIQRILDLLATVKAN